MRWDDWVALERFIRSPAYGRILNVMELASQQPEITFETVEKTQGIDDIAALRDNRKVTAARSHE
jgi:hypothetical protein